MQITTLALQKIQSLVASFKRITHGAKYQKASFHSHRIPSYMNAEGKKKDDLLFVKDHCSPLSLTGQNPAVFKLLEMLILFCENLLSKFSYISEIFWKAHRYTFLPPTLCETNPHVQTEIPYHLYRFQIK